MKPVTVITGAIAIIVGSVLLTGSGQTDNYPNEPQEEPAVNSVSDKTTHRKHGKFIQASPVSDSF